MAAPTTISVPSMLPLATPFSTVSTRWMLFIGDCDSDGVGVADAPKDRLCVRLIDTDSVGVAVIEAVLLIVGDRVSVAECVHDVDLVAVRDVVAVRVSDTLSVAVRDSVAVAVIVAVEECDSDIVRVSDGESVAEDDGVRLRDDVTDDDFDAAVDGSVCNLRVGCH